ncbi:MAG TPA: hypothetical protein VJ600_00700 [Holophagaceae bacterium]|nr:hypothetical protein [Holophagaceae bacterium]
MAACQTSLVGLQADDDLLRRLASAVPPPAAAAGPADALLGQALDALDGARTQAEALQRLLDGMAPLAARCALFVLKQDIPSLYGWRGFEGESPKPGSQIVPPPDLVDLIQGRGHLIRELGSSYWTLLAPLSSLRAADVRIMPLRMRRRTLALVMFDAGLQPAIAHPEQARALVMATAATLGVISAMAAEGSGGTSTMELPAAPAQAAPPPPPPAAVEPPPHAARTQSLPLPPLPPTSPRSTSPDLVPRLERTHPGLEPTPAASRPAIPLPPPPAPATPAAGDLDPKTRAAAERLARVLVGDIELYFPAKVEQAKTQGNLYGLLREELERSRHTFIERFGEPLEAAHGIFRQTVVGQLCEGDRGKLGKAPWA